MSIPAAPSSGVSLVNLGEYVPELGRVVCVPRAAGGWPVLASWPLPANPCSACGGAGCAGCAGSGCGPVLPDDAEPDLADLLPRAPAEDDEHADWAERRPAHEATEPGAEVAR